MQLTGFQDRLAFVSGAGGGIGQAVVRALLDAGARVIACDLPAALEAIPQGAQIHALDVSDGDAVQSVVDQVQIDHGPISLGVHTAGILMVGPLLQLAPQDWDRIIATNLTGSFNVTRSLGAAMVQAGGGALVAVSSNAAVLPRLNMGAYAATKSALTMLVRCLGLELAAQGVRCNVVAPGSTLTPMQTGMWAHGDGAGQQAVIQGDNTAYRTGIPLRKLATPQDISDACMFLLSEQAAQITMADLFVDGGATLRG